MTPNFIIILCFGILSVMLVLVNLRASKTRSPRKARRSLYNIFILLAIVSIGFAVGFGSGLFGRVFFPKILASQF